MLIVADPRGAVAVTQAEHAVMCAAIADVWGAPGFELPSPAAPLRLAAEQHELHWEELDGEPPLNRSTGLPASVMQLHFSHYIDGQVECPRTLAERDPHAGLLCSYKHGDVYPRPGPLAALSADGRRLRRFFADSARLQRSLRPLVDANDEDIERGWRLVRTWDALSHDLLLDRIPRARPNVPDGSGALVTLHLDHAGDGAIVVDPWPFVDEEVAIPVTGRLLTTTFTDEGAMRAALVAAPRVTLTYRLVGA